LLSSTPATFLANTPYYIGTWRRAPYDVTTFPLALNGFKSCATLNGYDADGSLWIIGTTDVATNGLILQSVEGPEPLYLKADLTLSNKPGNMSIILS